MASPPTSAQPKSLLSVLTSNGSHTLIKRDGTKVPVNDLTGKTIGIYFAANRSPPCKMFNKKLVTMYNELKNKTANFEIIFVSDDESQSEFQKSLNDMPWLTLPFRERRTEAALTRICGVQRIPALVIFAPDSDQVLQSNGRGLVVRYGSQAYPFTNEHIAALEDKQAKNAAKLPETINHPGHEHPLHLKYDPYQQGGMFGCDVCEEEGSGWAYHCTVQGCSYDLHPTCVDPAYDLNKRAIDRVVGKVVDHTKTTGKVLGTHAGKGVWWLWSAFLGFVISSLFKAVKKDPWRDLASSSSSSSSSSSDDTSPASGKAKKNKPLKI